MPIDGIRKAVLGSVGLDTQVGVVPRGKVMPFPPRDSHGNFSDNMGILFNAHLHVLVAEDNSDDVFLIKVAFQKATRSTTLRIVADGEEAVAYLEGKVPFDDRTKFPVPNLIVSDLKMPRMDGFELIKWVRADPLKSTIPIVVLSSSGQPADVRKAYQLGANSFLVKPPTLDELVQLIRVTFDYWSLCESPNGLDVTS